MSSGPITFAEHLLRFAQSVDTLDQNGYEQALSLIFAYLKDNLQATQVALCCAMPIDDAPGVGTEWSDPQWKIASTLKDDKGDYRSHLTFALGEQKGLWVISDNDRPLSDDNPGIDMWSKFKPEHLLLSPTGGNETRTSIILATRDHDLVVFGVLLVELTPRVEMTKLLQEQMELIANAVGQLYSTHRAADAERKLTSEVLRKLRDLRDTAVLARDAKPRLFVASPKRGPAEVQEAIDEVLKGFADFISVRNWFGMTQPGNINTQLETEIQQASFGICYLSEPDPHHGQSDHEYRDNANVLMEAGMLHVATQANAVGKGGWIPIREEGSPPPPFDFAALRTVTVQRNRQGEFHKEDFQASLAAALEALLDQEG